LRPWRYSGVGYVHLPESLTNVSSSGRVDLPPCCNTNDFGDVLRPWRYSGVGYVHLPESHY
ncbi:hypothetical protein, partial [Yersinia enterocolitica]|uniref:hypothetical protein n=1 Tax=Yersinia enterocolitica TaxID=630 RepID=UPI001CC00E40